jgi:PD-(D/E)XK nuclease superfamily protein
VSIEWSFSTDRVFRRCQREVYYKQIAACHNSNDRLRKEAHLLKQIKSPEMWRGNVIHTAIEKWVVPYWRAGSPVPWPDVIRQARDLATRQFEFSTSRGFRLPGATKASVGDGYCALSCHEPGAKIAGDELVNAHVEVERAISNLSRMQSLLEELEGRGRYWTELSLGAAFEGAQLIARIDLLFFRGRGQPTILDWKTHTAQSSGNGALQTAFYGWLLHQDERWHQPQPADIELVEVDLSKGAVQRHRFDAERFAEIEDFAYRSVTQMLAVYGDASFEDQSLAELLYASNPNTCRFCVFAQLCREASDGRFPTESLRAQESLPFES